MAFTYYVLLLLVLTSIAFADERREGTLSQSEDKPSQLDDNVHLGLLQRLVLRQGTDVGGLVENMQIVLTMLQDQQRETQKIKQETQEIKRETQEIKQEQYQQREQLNGTIDRLKQLKQEQQHNSTQMKRVLDELKQSSEQLNGAMGNLNQEQQEMHELLHQHHQQIMVITRGWCRGNKAGPTTIYVGQQPLSVPCDGKQGIVILNRVDGLHFTNRTWADYKKGFGDTSKSFWIGFDILHKLTSLNKCKLVVEIEDWDGETRMAKYEHIHIEDETNGYRLNVAQYSGTAGDGLAAASSSNLIHHGMKFSTTDRDNDKSGGNCATRYGGGGWWYNVCYYSNLAGKYFSYSDRTSYYGVVWSSWKGKKYSFKRAKMTLVLR